MTAGVVTTFCLLSLFVVLGSCQFKITIVQNNVMAAPTDYMIYCNETIIQSMQRHLPLVWAAGSLSRAPASNELLLHNSGFAGMSASLVVGDQVFNEGPVLVEERSYWILSVDDDYTITWARDGIPHRGPANGIQVEKNATEDLNISVRRHEAWRALGGGIRFGPPLGNVSPFVDSLVVFPPVASLTLTETTIPRGSHPSDFVGKPVGVLPMSNVSVTFKVLPPFDGQIVEVVLERLVDASGVGYRTSYRYDSSK